MKRILLVLVVIISACSSIRIRDVKQEDGFSISKYKTFNFFDVDASGDALGPNYKSNLDLLKASITKQVTAKGITLNTSEPDLMVNIGIVVAEKIQTRETDFSNPADRVAYMGQRNYSWKSQTIEVDRYREGRVTLDFVDRSTGKLVWQGSADSVVPEKEKNVPPLIEEGMTKLFAKIK